MLTTNQSPPAHGVLPPLRTLSQPGLLLLILLLLLRTALLFAGDGLVYGLLRLGGPAASWDDALMWSNLTVMVTDVITIVVVAGVLRRSGSSLRALLTTKTPGRDIAWGLLLALISVIGFYAATFIGNLIAYLGPPPAPTGDFTAPPLWLGLISLLLMPATIAVAEEVLYRGYLQSVLTLRWGRWAGLIVTSGFFAVQHLALTSADPQAWLARAITTLLAGVMFGLLAWWMKRLWPVIIGHWIVDVIGLGLPMFMASLG